MPAVKVTEAARAIGHSSPSQLYRWINLGRMEPHRVSGPDGVQMLELDGLAEYVESLRQKRRHNVPIRAGNSPAAPKSPRSQSTADGDVPDYNESRARREWEQANLLELERRKKEGELIERAAVERADAELAAMVKTKLLGVPARAKQRIPHLSAGDVAVLMELQREALEEISHG